MTVTLRQGDARAVLATLPAASVHCVITSPPYWAQRRYAGSTCTCVVSRIKDTSSTLVGSAEGTPNHQKADPDCLKCGGTGKGEQEYSGIGNEATPQEWCDALVEVFRAVRRVLRDDGVLFVNCGDKMDAKSLMGLPWMLAFALQADGWILRSDIIWHKVSPMPQSVTDRPTTAHEYLFMFAKQGRYYWDATAVSETKAEATLSDARDNTNGHRRERGFTGAASNGGTNLGGSDGTRNARSVQAFAPSPFSVSKLGKYGPMPSVDHFALFPISLPTWCIRAGTSEKGCCGTCGAPWVRQISSTRTFESGSGKAGNMPAGKNGQLQGGGETLDVRRGPVTHTQTTGWAASCACPPAPPVPCTVLDPFSGAGTTGLAAHRLGRNYIGCELSQAYIDLSNARLLDDAPMLAGGQA